LHGVQLVSLDAVIQLQIRDVGLNQVVLLLLFLESLACGDMRGGQEGKEEKTGKGGDL
jgi:hypothetical protein